MVGIPAITPSRALRALAASTIAGIAAHSCMERSSAFPAVAIVPVAVLVAGAVLERGARRLVFACLVLFFVAFWRYDVALAKHPALAGRMPEGAVPYRGTVVGEPSVGLARTSVTVDAFPEGNDGGLVRMRIATDLPVAASDGDTLRWECVAERVEPEGRFSYGDWLFARGYGATCTVRAPPVRTGYGAPDAVRALLAVKDAFRRRVRMLYPEPDASFLLGLLIGDRDGIPGGIEDAFRATGTTHILAVSGYNVTQVTRLALLLLALAGVRRRRAALVSIVAVIAFALIAGTDASVVRAAIMGSIGLVAAAIGRRYSGTNGLLTAAAVMLFVNPFLLRHDVGFLLSFASLIGLQTLAGPFARRMTAMPDAWGFRQVAAETLAATFATLPLVVYAFGAIAPASLPVNMIVLPLVPVASALGAAAAALSVPAPTVGLVVALLGTVVLRIVRAVIMTVSVVVPSITVSGGMGTFIAGYASVTVLWYALTRVRPVPLLRQKMPKGVSVHVHDAA